MSSSKSLPPFDVWPGPNNGAAAGVTRAAVCPRAVRRTRPALLRVRLARRSGSGMVARATVFPKPLLPVVLPHARPVGVGTRAAAAVSSTPPRHLSTFPRLLRPHPSTPPRLLRPPRLLPRPPLLPHPPVVTASPGSGGKYDVNRCRKTLLTLLVYIGGVRRIVVSLTEVSLTRPSPQVGRTVRRTGNGTVARSTAFPSTRASLLLSVALAGAGTTVPSAASRTARLRPSLLRRASLAGVAKVVTATTSAPRPGTCRSVRTACKRALSLASLA